MWLTVLTTLSLYAAVVISPGPNFALISRLAVSGNRSTAVGATFGLALAATFYAILSMSGLALVLKEVSWLTSAVQIAGGCYLVYLGLMAWFAGHTTSTSPKQKEAKGFRRGFRVGMLVNLSNPKGIAFFIGLYAVAIPVETALWAKLLIVFGGFTLEIVWYGLVTLLFSSRRAQTFYQQFGLWIERVLGTLLAAFGFRLIAEKILD